MRIELHGHFGDSKYLGDKLFELRWKSGIRVYYFKSDRNEIKLLLGGDKNAQEKDIQKAKTLIV